MFFGLNGFSLLAVLFITAILVAVVSYGGVKNCRRMLPVSPPDRRLCAYLSHIWHHSGFT